MGWPEKTFLKLKALKFKIKRYLKKYCKYFA